MPTKKLTLANLADKLTRTAMKKIVAGSGNDSCPVGRSYWNAYRATNGICQPSGYECLCVAGGAATYSYECNGYQV